MNNMQNLYHSRIILRCLIILNLILIGLFSVIVNAQDEGTELETYEFSDSGTSIVFPKNWRISEQDDGSLQLRGDTITMYIYDPTVLLETYEIDSASTPSDVIMALPDILGDVELEIDTDAVEEVDENGVVTATYVYIDEANTEQTGWVALLLGEDQPGLIGYRSAIDDFGDAEEMAMKVIATFSAGGRGLNINLEQINYEPTCFVSVAVNNTVRVHVGPGLNRTPLAFVPAGEEYAVYGQAEASDGSVWYKLKKSEVAPNKSGDERWVNSGEVNSSGDCESIPEAAVPPVIPIAAQVLPASGIWMSTFLSYNYTCPDGNSGNVVTNETEPMLVLVAPDGEQLIIYNITLTRAQVGKYTGQYNFNYQGTFVTATIDLTVASETEAQWAETFVLQGCNFTTYYKAVYQG